MFSVFSHRRSSYVAHGEGCYDSDDSGMSDFINDDDDDDNDESTVESDSSCDSKKKDSGICSTKRNKKGRKKKLALDSSEEQENSLSEDDDVPLSVVRNKNTSDQKSTPKTTSINASDSDESFSPRNKSTKRRKVLMCSDSDDNDRQSAKPHIINTEKKNVSDVGEKSDSGDLLTYKNSKLVKPSVLLRPRSKRVQNLTQQHEDKNRKMLDTLRKKRQTAKLDPKERIAMKQLPGNDSDGSFSSFSSSEGEHNPFQEAEEVFAQHSSELEEDDDDRDFIVNDEQSSDEGLNSDGASQFLKLLDTFTGKQKDEFNGIKTAPHNTEETIFKRRLKRRKKRKERKASKWRRIKMEDDSEDSDVANVIDLCHRNPSLHVAVLKNDILLVEKLIKEDPDCVYELGNRKRTALHLAALGDRVEFVKLLLDHGADRTALDCYHLPAIAYAMDGHPDCVRLLLDHANVKSVSKSMRNNLQGMTLLHFAVGEKRDGLDCDNRARCLELLSSKDKKICSKLLEERDARTFAPVVAAVYSGQHKVQGKKRNVCILKFKMY